MAVTITIRNNRDYINRTCPEKIGVKKGPHNQTAPTYPFEVKLPMGIFRTLRSALGLTGRMQGEMDGRVLIRAIKRTPTVLLVRAEREGDDSSHNLHILFAGIDYQEAKGYLNLLAEVANEACRREERVIWG